MNAPHVRKHAFWAGIALSACLSHAHAQGTQAQRGAQAQAQPGEAARPQGPRSGDAWIDARIVDIDAYAARYPEAFVDEVARYHAVPRAYVVAVVRAGRLSPGEVYYACVVAQALGLPCRTVANARAGDPAAGWGESTRRLGLEPGSAAAVRVRRAFVDSYARWARPLPPDPAAKKPASARAKR